MTTTWHKACAVTAMLLLACRPSLADEFQGVKQLMSETEFKQAGMEKLSAPEIQVLNRWIAKFSAGRRSLAVPLATAGGDQSVAPVQGAGLAISSHTASISVSRVDARPALAPTTTPAPRDRLTAQSSAAAAVHIKGEFSGWSGKTRFHLSNGQVWQQRLPGRWKAHLESPRVRIEKNLFGYYKMTVVEQDRGIGVTRVDRQAHTEVARSTATSVAAQSRLSSAAPAARDTPPPSALRSHIVGEFFGWTGNTRFRLSNGQVWQQRLAGRWKTHLINPKVKIEKNLFGFYKMTIEGQDRGIGVTRVN